VEIIPGSHRLGLLSANGSTLSSDNALRHCPEERVLPLALEAGHGVLMHNWLIHRSGINPTGQPRRAFTACYMDGRTRSILTGNHFPLIAGQLNDAPYPFVHQLKIDLEAVRHSQRCAEEYACSLEMQVGELRAMQQEAQSYAKSLESERESLRQMPAPKPSGLLARLSNWRR
jgi:hypothetical protein